MNSPAFRRCLSAVGLSRTCVRTAASSTTQKGSPGGPPDHGEKIWVFNHMLTNQVVYSMKPVIDSNKAMRQIPFNGKKLRPAKLRKDYWHPMAVICFRKNFGRGVIGRSAFQKLREFRKLHELSWGDEMLKGTKKERGMRLNDQRANTIADMAAVLAGRGLGNLVAEANASPDRPWLVSKKEEQEKKLSKRLYRATIFWANQDDHKYAQQWTGNVTHERMRVIAGKKYWYDPEADLSEREVAAEALKASKATAAKPAETAGGEELSTEAKSEPGLAPSEQTFGTDPAGVTTPIPTAAQPTDRPSEASASAAGVGGSAPAADTTTADATPSSMPGEIPMKASEGAEVGKKARKSKEKAAVEPEDPDLDLWSPEESAPAEAEAEAEAEAGAEAEVGVKAKTETAETVPEAGAGEAEATLEPKTEPKEPNEPKAA